MQYLSCAPALLYSEVINDAPDTAARLLDASITRVGQCSPLFWTYKPEVLERTSFRAVTSNEPWRQSLHAMYHNTPNFCAGSMTCSLSDVYINNNAIYFGGSPETTMLYEMHRPNDRLALAVNHGIGLRAATKFNRDADRRLYFYIGSAGLGNYGHWLVDDLPRLKSVERLIDHDRGSRWTLLLTAHSPAFDDIRRQTIFANPALADVDIIFLDAAVNYHLEQVYYASPVTYHPHTKLRSAMRYLRTKYASSNCDQHASERLFVTRSHSSRRNLVNRSEIEDLLRAKGFDVFECDGASFIDQTTRFASAKLIVGVMGAAMTNCVFSKIGSTEIHLACEGWVEPFYWDLADACEHQYIPVYGRPYEGGAPYDVPFHIEPAMLEEALASAENYSSAIER